MRVKKKQLIITFASTANAMAVEAFCTDNSLPGRLIPIPREITAGCGLAWKANPEEKELLISLFKKESVTFDGVYELEI